jgi:protein involved in polysaccharide export with SLBB domain
MGMGRSLILVSILLSGLFNDLLGQELPDPANITDSQLKEVAQQAQQAGYSPQQIEPMARARGLSTTEISALRQRLSDIQTETGSTMIDESVLREEFGDLEIDLEDIKDNSLDGSEIGGRIYGSELFDNRNLTFAPSQNIPTPKDYQLGPGDELVIDLWGASENSYRLVVTPEGNIKIPKIGPVFVNGLTIEQASNRLLGRLTQLYAGLVDSQYGEKNTYGQVSLGRLRSIRVNVIGEVKVPGTYTISSLSTLLHVLYVAGGPSHNGSYREIEVYRNGKKIISFDAYAYLTRGIMSSNIRLKDQDLIKIPVYQKRVQIQGEVKNPAIYELLENETLQDVVDLAGGFTDEAYKQLLTIMRNTDQAKRILTIKTEQFDHLELVSGDEITVAKILDTFENRVSIEGALRRPGAYELTDSLHLSELILKAEGITPDAFLARGFIRRFNDDLTVTNIDFSVKDVLDGQCDILLKPEDMVTISSKFNLKDQPTIRIQGEVRNPQSFFFQDSLIVEDVIFMAGGFKESAARSFVEVARRIDEESFDENKNTRLIFKFPIDESLSLSQEDASFKLEPYDVLTIRRSPFYFEPVIVEIEGEVVYPGKYVLEKRDERISDIIRRAGGFTDYAFVEGATLIRRTEYTQAESGTTSHQLNLRKKLLQNELSLDNTLATRDKRFLSEEFVGIDLKKIMQSPGSKNDLTLQDGDIISLPREISTVRVRGEVLNPGRFRYDVAPNIKSAIALSGGTNSNAQLRKSYVIYLNGDAQRTRSFLGIKNYPKVLPGSEIIIPKKPERKGVSAQDAIGLSSSLLTLVFIIDRIVN